MPSSSDWYNPRLAGVLVILLEIAIAAIRIIRNDSVAGVTRFLVAIVTTVSIILTSAPLVLLYWIVILFAAFVHMIVFLISVVKLFVPALQVDDRIRWSVALTSIATFVDILALIVVYQYYRSLMKPPVNTVTSTTFSGKALPTLMGPPKFSTTQTVVQDINSFNAQTGSHKSTLFPNHNSSSTSKVHSGPHLGSSIPPTGIKVPFPSSRNGSGPPCPESDNPFALSYANMVRPPQVDRNLDFNLESLQKKKFGPVLQTGGGRQW